MSRSAPARRVNRALAASLGVAVILGVVVSAGACATQETTPAPDAGVPPCQTGPFIFCQPVAADQPGCSTDEGASRFLARLPRATRYPVDCVVNFVGERDPQGDCRNDGVCKCLIIDVAITPPPADGGTEAGAAAPPPPASATPQWNCSP